MGVCYSALIEVRHGDNWYGDAFFKLSKSYELARCFPHAGWPRDERGFRTYAVSAVAMAFHDKAFADTGLQWGTLAEVEGRYAQEVRKPEARDFAICRALFAAAHALAKDGDEVRLLLWSD